jgi:nicotinate phosphoribosyltransferase
VLYKLAEVERDGEVLEAAKFTATKVTYPGRKQVYRQTDSAGNYAGDVIALENESMPGEPLLIPVMRGGKRVGPAAPLARSQRRCQTQLERLPVALRALAVADPPYPVRHSARLEALLEEVRERTMRTAAR